MNDNKQKILLKAFGPILARNKIFIKCHEGETCYIVGNGASLKNMDLSAFSDYPAIGLNFLCLHKHFRSLNLKYYAAIEPFFLYPFKTNPYTNRIQFNILGNLLKKSLLCHQDVPFFTSISNIFGSKFSNAYYLHHFGADRPSKEYLDISASFSFMRGALWSGVGLAITMGFKKAYLLGCDYLVNPAKMRHFYSYGPSITNEEYYGSNPFIELVEEVEGIIDLRLITDIYPQKGVPQLLPLQDYKQFTGRSVEYRENSEIVAPEYLSMLDEAFRLRQFANNIYSED